MFRSVQPHPPVLPLLWRRHRCGANHAAVAPAVEALGKEGERVSKLQQLPPLVCGVVVGYGRVCPLNHRHANSPEFKVPVTFT